ncbi:MAG: hypothetical protein JO207_07270 [Verrucomicrobia bacterium]|nr:hypothetical protein [Verrucomicrobiota bacterium]MBV8533584.1 hypothetical protein [Verrucomicrobiota bacterium]
MVANSVLPDLQASILCEDVRQELNGLQTLVGVIHVLPTPALPVGLLKLCLWTRWCGGYGKFRQTSRILGIEEVQIIAESHIDFELKELEGQVTNVNFFAGVQFQSFGIHHVEILLDGELLLRYPLPVVKV